MSQHEGNVFMVIHVLVVCFLFKHGTELKNVYVRHSLAMAHKCVTKLNDKITLAPKSTLRHFIFNFFENIMN